MGGSRERRRRRKFILLVLGGILVVAALGFRFASFDDGISARKVTGQGSSELTTSTRVQVSPRADGTPSDLTSTPGPTSSNQQTPTTVPAPSGGPTAVEGPTSSAGPTTLPDPIPGPDETTGPQDGGEPGAGFSLTVIDVTGLFPGDRRPLRVTFTNRYPFDVWVTEVVTTVRGTPGCAAKHLVTGTHSLGTAVHVPANSRAAGGVPFGMRPSAPNACQGASFDIQLSATAVKR